MALDIQTARAARFAYPLGLLLMLAPLLELTGRIWPIQWYLVQWRFQTELALVNAAPVILIGALVVATVAWVEEDIGILKLAGLLLITFGVLLLPTMAMMALDGMQMRQMARAEVRGPLRNNIIVSVLRGGLASLAALSLGVGAMKLAKLSAQPMTSRSAGASPRGRAPEKKDDGLLIVTSDD
jgi:hypothetical protein